MTAKSEIKRLATLDPVKMAERLAKAEAVVNAYMAQLFALQRNALVEFDAQRNKR